MGLQNLQNRAQEKANMSWWKEDLEMEIIILKKTISNIIDDTACGDAGHLPHDTNSDWNLKPLESLRKWRGN